MARLDDDRYMALHMFKRDAVSFNGSKRLEGASGITRLYEGGVAVIDVSGPIYRHASSAPSGAIATSQIARDLVVARKHEDVRSILLCMDTPGGEATGIDEVAQKIFETRSVKSIETYVEGLGASAGYYLAAGSSRISASRMALVGSIGVVMGIPVPAGQTEEGQMVHSDGRGNFHMEFVSSVSPKKRVNPMTEDGRAYYQKLVNETADVFVKDVARFRGLSAEQLPAQYGDGGVSVAGSALSMGLVDAIGSFESVLERMQSNGGHTPNAVSVSAPALVPGADGGEADMGLLDKILGAKTEGNQGQPGATSEQAPKTMEDFLAELEEKRPAVMAQFEDKAVLFAVKAVTGNKAWPANQASIAAKMLTAMADDALFGGLVSFFKVSADGKLEEVEGTRQEQVEAELELTPAHTMTQEGLVAVQKGKRQGMVLSEGKTEKVQVAEPGDDTGVEVLSDEELLAATPGGRRVLAQKTNGNGHK